MSMFLKWIRESCVPSSYNTTQSNLKKKKCILARGFKGEVYNGRGAMQQSAEARCRETTSSTVNRKQRKRPGSEERLETIPKDQPQWRTSPSKALSPISYRTSPNMAFNRGLSIPMQELTGDISHSNHHKLYSAHMTVQGQSLGSGSSGLGKGPWQKPRTFTERKGFHLQHRKQKPARLWSLPGPYPQVTEGLPEPTHLLRCFHILILWPRKMGFGHEFLVDPYPKPYSRLSKENLIKSLI